MELIAEIFLLRVHEERSRLYNNRRPILKWGDWYNFLFVCRCWNAAAMGMPRLWNFVHTCSSMTCIRTMIARSKDTPLHVEAIKHGRHSDPDDGGKPDMEWLHLILEQSYRIEYLSLLVSDDVANEFLTIDQLPVSLPIIHSLKVDTDSFGVWTPFHKIPFPFAPSPSLRSLSSLGATFQQVKPYLHSKIQTLHLRLQYEKWTSDGADSMVFDCIPTTKLYDFLEAVVTMHSLVVLNLESWLGSVPVSFNYPPIILPQLKRLSLMLNTPNLDFLRAISCPPGLHFQLVVGHGPLDGEMLKSIITACGRLARWNDSELGVRMVDLESWDWEDITIRFFARLVTPWKICIDEPDTVILELCFARPGCVELSTVYDTIFGQDIVSNLDTLRLSNPCELRERSPEVPIASISTALWKLQGLRTLIVDSWPKSRVCELLSQTSTSSLPEPIFPNLEWVLNDVVSVPTEHGYEYNYMLCPPTDFRAPIVTES